MLSLNKKPPDPDILQTCLELHSCTWTWLCHGLIFYFGIHKLVISVNLTTHWHVTQPSRSKVLTTKKNAGFLIIVLDLDTHLTWPQPLKLSPSKPYTSWTCLRLDDGFSLITVLLVWLWIKHRAPRLPIGTKQTHSPHHEFKSQWHCSHPWSEAQKRKPDLRSNKGR